MSSAYRASIQEDKPGAAGVHAAITGALTNRTPLAIAKLGTSELNILYQYCIMEQAKQRGEQAPSYVPMTVQHITVNAGVFPATHDAVSNCGNELREGLRRLDVIAAWNPSMDLEEACVTSFIPTAPRVGLTTLEPYYWPRDLWWTSALAGRRVLVISPFHDSITKQYQRRNAVWAALPGFLPDFTLLTIPFPLSYYAMSEEQRRGADLSWAATLDKTRRAMTALDFDIALIGVGAASLPLAAHAKALGKVGVHLGGALQIMFGVKGARWDGSPAMNAWFNDAWVRPSAAETPAGAVHVERACYW